MIRLSYKKIIAIGFILVFLGFILPLLMVMKILESTFFLNFFSFIASMFGVILGLMGAAQMAVSLKHTREKDKNLFTAKTQRTPRKPLKP